MILYKNVSFGCEFTYWSQVEVGAVFRVRLNVILKYGFVQLTLVLLLTIATPHRLLSAFLALVHIVFIHLFHLKFVELPDTLILPPLHFWVAFSDQHDVRHVVLSLLVVVIVVVKCP